MTGKEWIKFIQDNNFEDEEVYFGNLMGEDKLEDIEIESWNPRLRIITNKNIYNSNPTELPYEDVSMNLRHILSDFGQLDRTTLKSMLNAIENLDHGHVDLPNFQSMNKKDAENMLRLNNIIFNGGVVAIEYKKDGYGEGNHSVEFLGEDDGNLFRKGYSFSSFWLQDMIDVCKLAIEELKDEE